MTESEPYWGRRALDFVDAIEASKTTASVISQFEKVIGELGFHAYIMAGIPMPGQSLRELTIANGWPRNGSKPTTARVFTRSIRFHGIVSTP